MKRRLRSRSRPARGIAAAERSRAPHEARIYRSLQVNGSSFWTLFDSGARRTYVNRAVGRRIGAKPLPLSVRSALGGRRYVITEACQVIGTVEGRAITADALVVDRLFPDEKGREIEVLLGMETMETWGIGLDTAHQRLDFTHYAREVVEGAAGS